MTGGIGRIGIGTLKGASVRRARPIVMLPRIETERRVVRPENFTAIV